MASTGARGSWPLFTSTPPTGAPSAWCWRMPGPGIEPRAPERRGRRSGRVRFQHAEHERGQIAPEALDAGSVVRVLRDGAPERQVLAAFTRTKPAVDVAAV